MIRLCVPVRDDAEVAASVAAGADGVVLASPALLATARSAGVAVGAVRCPLALPYETPPEQPAVPAGTTVLLAAPTPQPGDTRSLERVKEFRLACIRALMHLGEWAERNDLTVCVASGVETFFEGSLEITEMLRAAQTPALRWTLNTCDAEASGEGVSGATDVGGDLLGHVVAEDWTGTPGEPLGRCAPGQGSVPFGRLFEQLDFLGYEQAIEVAGGPARWAAAISVLREARDG